MSDCESVQGRLQEYLLGLAGLQSRHSVEAHLKICDRCRGSAERLRAELSLLATDTFAGAKPSADFRARFWKQVEEQRGRREAWWAFPGFVRWAVPTATAAVALLVVWGVYRDRPAQPVPESSAPVEIAVKSPEASEPQEDRPVLTRETETSLPVEPAVDRDRPVTAEVTVAPPLPAGVDSDLIEDLDFMRYLQYVDMLESREGNGASGENVPLPLEGAP